MPRPTLFLIIFLVTIALQKSYAASSDEAVAQKNNREPSTDSIQPDKTEVAYVSPISLEWLDAKHSKWSEDIASVGRYLDSFMDDTSAFQDANRSYLKVYFDAEVSRYSGLEVTPRFRVSLDLPVTKKKLRLVIENDPDQEQGLKERNLSDLPSVERDTDDSFYGSIRYLFDSKDWDRLSFDWGIKARWPPDPFARFRAVRGWELNEHWYMTYSQEVFVFESKGFGSYSQFDFDRRLSETFLFRATSVIDWHERTNIFDLLEQFSIFQDINDKRAIQYAIGFVGEESHGSRITNYYTKATYRRRLYKDWLFYELTPGVEAQRAENFSPNPFIAFRLEMLFSADASRKLTTRLY